MQTDDEGTKPVRDVRKAISAEFGDDPERLVEHYIVQQERHRDRLIRFVRPAPNRPVQWTGLHPTADTWLALARLQLDPLRWTVR